MTVGHIRFYYVNGMMANEVYSHRMTQKIKAIVKSTSIYHTDEKQVLLHYNGSTSSDRVGVDLLAGLVGSVASLYAFNQESKRQGDSQSRAIGVVGAAMLTGALVDYNSMQEDKNDIARDL